MFSRRSFCQLTAALILAFAVCLFFAQDRAAFAAPAFSDIEGHWAEQNVLEMSAYGIVHGYPGGLFKPNEDIEFQQAIVMIVNTLGWAKEAAQADLTGLTFPSGTWAKGYLALAVKKGMLTKEGLPSLDPKRPAARWEVASLLCLALGFEPDPAALYFRDTEQINENYRGYVGAIVKRKIMIGLPGNIFAPQMKITRAQMCTMLSRLIEQNWVAPPPPRKRLVGRITGVGEDEETVTVKNLSGEKTIQLPEDCPLFDGGKMAARSSLEKNMRISVIVDDEQKAYYGRILSDFGPAERAAEGFLLSFAPGKRGYSLTLETETGETLSFDLYDDARLFERSREITAADLKKDSYVKVSLDNNNRAYEVEIFQPEKISGTLVDLKGDELTIKSRGIRHDYQLSNNVRATRNALRPMNLTDLKPGDYVSIVVLNDKVHKIDCLSDMVSALSGMVSKVRGQSIYIYVQNEERRYELAEGVEVFKDGRSKDLDDLERGNYVNFVVADDQKVISIGIIEEEEGEFTGSVLYLGTTGRPFITLRTPGGLELDFDINQNASVFRYGDGINLEDIVPGAKVRIEVDEGRVEEIEVLDDLNITIEGRIVNINEGKNRLTLEINGRNYNYNLSAALTVVDADGKNTVLSELMNCRVEAKLEGGAIKEIRVKNG